MVAIVAGSSLGLSLSSQSTHGGAGVVGNARFGDSDERVYVNAATGNLVVQSLDDSIAARGADLLALRTYNSQGRLVQGVQDTWAMGFARQRLVLPASPSTPGSSLTRIDGDGAEALATWDATASVYASSAGAGAYDRCSWVAADGQWAWTDGETGTVERYDASGRLVRTIDVNGLQVSYEYDAAGRVARVLGANTEVLTCRYDTSGRLQEVATSSQGGPLTTRARYGYDAQGRLQGVSWDLDEPQEGDITDGLTYTLSYTYDGTSSRIASIRSRTGLQVGVTYGDVNGERRVATLTDGLGQVTRFTYDVAQRTTTVLDPSGVATVLRYDAQGQLQQVETGATGATVVAASFTYTARGDVASVTNGASETTVYEYDARGNQTLQRDAQGNTIRRTWTAQNLISTETVYLAPDPDGAGPGAAGTPLTTEYIYNPTYTNRLRFVISPEGRVTETRWTSYGQPIGVLVYGGDALLAPGASRSLGDLSAWAKAQDPASITLTQNFFNVRGLHISTTVFAQFDPYGWGVADGNESETRRYFNSRGQVMRTFDGEDVETVTYFDGMGRLTVSKDGLGQQTKTSYELTAARVKVTLANGLTTTSTYDAAGRLTAVVQASASRPDLGTTSYAYDAAGRLLMATDPVGNRSFSLYDSRGQLEAEVAADGTLTEFIRDAAGRVTRTIRYTVKADLSALVDTLGRPLNPALAAVRPAATSASDASTWTVYDSAGRITFTVDATGGVTENFYDGASRLLSSVRYATAISTAGLGNAPTAAQVRPATTDTARDQLARSILDEAGRPLLTVSAGGTVVGMAYDAAGRLAVRTTYAKTVAASLRAGATAKQLTDAATGTANAVETFFYDGRGWLAGEIDALGYLTEYGSDRVGRRISSRRYATAVTVAYTSLSTLASLRPAVNAQDRLATWEYDDNGRCTRETAPDGTAKAFTYDTLGNCTSVLVAAGTVDQRAALARRFDLQGRLVGELTPEGYAMITAGMTQAAVDLIWREHGQTHAYDNAGRRTSTTDTSGNVTSFFHDAQGRVVRQVLDSDSGGLALTTRYEYDAHGNLKKLTQGSTVTEFSYDRLGRKLQEIVDPLGLRLTRTFTYDAAGNVRSSTDASGNRTLFFYTQGNDLAYTVDAAGNIESRSYDAAGRVVRSARYSGTVSEVGTSTTLAQLAAKIDAIDDAAKDEVQHSVYDRLGRLQATVNGLGEVVRFTWDGQGRLVEQIAYAKPLVGWTPGNAVEPTADAAHDRRQRTVYDLAGRPIWTIDGTGAVTTMAYDRRGNLIDRLAYAKTLTGTVDPAAKPLPAASTADVRVRTWYDAANRPQWIVDALGGVTRNLYDMEGRLKQVVRYASTLPAGSAPSSVTPASTRDRVTTFLYDAAGRRVVTIDPEGAVTRQLYDANGNVTQEIRYARKVTPRAAGSVPSGVSVTADALNDRTTRMAWDAANRMVFSVDGAGAVTEYQYDGAGRVKLAIAYARPLSDTALAAFGASPSPATVRAALSVRNAEDRRTASTYDAAGRVKTTAVQVFQAGAWSAAHTVTTSYDGLDRVTGVLEAGAGEAGRRASTEYDGAGRVLATVNASLGRQEQTYDGVGNRISFRNEKGSTWTYDHDQAGRVRSEKSPLVELAAINASGEVSWTSASVETANTYDGLGNLTGRTEAVGRAEERTTLYAYDALGRQVRTTFPRATVYLHESDALLAGNGSNGNASRSEQMLSLASETNYDALGNAYMATDVAGFKSYKTHDRSGRVLAEVDPLGSLTRYEYNAFGEATAVTRFANACTVSAGPPVGITHAADAARDRRIETTYDRAGRVRMVTEPAAFVYDAGPVTADQAYDLAGRQTVTSYNAFGDVIEVARQSNREADAWVSEFRYLDQRGRLVMAVDAGRYATVFGYDAAGRQASRKEHATAISGSVTRDAQPVPAADAERDRLTTWTYDALGRKTAETRVNVLHSQPDTAQRIRGDLITRFGYDAVGNQVSLTTPGGATTLTQYDDLGRITGMVEPTVQGDGGTTITPFTAYKRDAHGNALLERRYAKGASLVNGVFEGQSDGPDRLTRRRYDAAGRLLTLFDAEGIQHHQSTDAFGRVVKEWQTVTTGVPGDTASSRTETLFTTWRYDGAGRQVAATRTPLAQGGPLVRTDMAYNAFGEMVGRSMTGDTFAEIFDYDQAGRLWRTNEGSGVTRIFLYDLLGNRTAEMQSAGLGGNDQNLLDAAFTVDFAANDANLRRTDFRFDALGRVVEQVQPRRTEAFSDLCMRSAAITWSLPTEGGGARTAILSWAPLAALGGGEVKVVLSCVPYAEEGSPGPIFEQVFVLQAERGDSGAEVEFTGPASVAAIHGAKVYKKDISGQWIELIDSRRPGYMFEAGRKSAVLHEFLQIAPIGTEQWSDVTTLCDFGSRYQFDLRGLDISRLQFRMMARVSGEASFRELARGNLADVQMRTTLGTGDLRPVVRRTLDRWGNVLAVADPRNAAWTSKSTYDDFNRLIERRDPLQQGATMTRILTLENFYDADGRLVATRDARGNTNHQSFDAQGHLTGERHADNGVVTHAFNGFGERVATLDAEGAKSTFAYDRLGRMVSATRLGILGADGTPVGIHVHKTNLDATNEAPWVSLDSLRQQLKETYTWDAAGRQASETNAAGETTRYAHDTHGNVVMTVRPGDRKTTATFDGRGNKLTERDPKGSTASWTYDAFSRLQQRVDLGGHTTSYAYDNAGQLKREFDGTRKSILYSYDLAGNLVLVDDEIGQKKTSYRHDEAGRKTDEKVVVQEGGRAVVVQDNHMGYDSMGRMVFVGDDHASVVMEYDGAGNRTKISTYVINFDGLAEHEHDQERFFQYDVMNRQTVVDAVSASGDLGATGHRLTYDRNGNRTSDTFLGRKVIETQVQNPKAPGGYYTTWSHTEGIVTESYAYDGLNRLLMIQRDGKTLDHRLYDAASRMVQSGPVEALPEGYLRELYGTDSTGATIQGHGALRRVHYFNAAGDLKIQRSMRGDGTNDHRVINDQIDAAGNVLSSRTVDSSGTKTYTTTLAAYDGYREQSVSGVSTRLRPGSSTSTYDANGHLVGVTDLTDAAATRTFINDHNGVVLAVRQGDRLLRQMVVNGEVLGSYGSGMDQETPRSSSGGLVFDDDIADFRFGYRSITPQHPSPAPGAYVVQRGDTLQSIAQRTYGDSRRWYQIAEANGLSSASDLRVGQAINLPNLVGGLTNADGVFEPYDPSRVVGDTKPYMADPKKKGNFFKQLVAAIVTVIVAMYAPGLLGAANGFWSGVVAGAAGSMAGQVTSMALGIQDKFSWKGVALGAISGGLTHGIGAEIGGKVAEATASKALGAAAQYGIASLGTQAIGVATGLQDRFSWSGVVASALGAGVGSAVGPGLTQALGKTAGAVAAGVISGSVAAVARGGRLQIQQVMVDAFGNALGESIASVSQPSSAMDWSGAPDQSAAESARLARGWNQGAANSSVESWGSGQSGNPDADWPNQTEAETARLAARDAEWMSQDDAILARKSSESVAAETRRDATLRAMRADALTAAAGARSGKPLVPSEIERENSMLARRSAGTVLTPLSTAGESTDRVGAWIRSLNLPQDVPGVGWLSQTQAASSAQYWASRLDETGNPLYAIPQGVATLWAEHSDEVAMVLSIRGGRGVSPGEAGAFGSLKGVKGDGLTAHHMPQAAAGRTGYSEGGALVLTQAEHIATRTYGTKGIGTLLADAKLSFREVLARDIADVRSIVGSKYNEGLRKLTEYYRKNFPELMSK